MHDSKTTHKIIYPNDSGANRLLSDFERNLVRQYKTAWNSIQAQLAEMYAKYGQDVKLEDMLSYNRLKNLELQVEKILSEVYGRSLKDSTKVFKEFYYDSYYNVGFAAENTLGLKLGFGVLNPKWAEKAINNPMDRIKWQGRLKDHHVKALSVFKDEITQGLILGNGYGKTANLIKGKVENLTNNALRIVRTESHRIRIQAKVDGYDDIVTRANSLGIEVKKVWVATLDDRTRDSHGSMDGQIADADGMFTLPSGVKTAGPGLSGIAAEDINCRCSIAVRVDGEPETRKDNITKEVIKYKTFKEWKEARL